MHSNYLDNYIFRAECYKISRQFFKNRNKCCISLIEKVICNYLKYTHLPHQYPWLSCPIT